MYKKLRKQSSEVNIIQIVHMYKNLKFLLSFLNTKWPSSAEQQVIATRFQLNYMFPHTVGVLDGTHIRLSSCPGGDPDYINRKSFPSMQLQVFAFFENSLKIGF